MSNSVLANLDLYAGDDLLRAEQCSSVEWKHSASSPNILRGILTDLRNAQLRHLAPRTLWLQGIEKDSGDSLTILYKGTLRTVNYCADAVYGSDVWDARAVRPGDNNPDIIIADHVLSRATGPKTLSFRTPQWVRQILRLSQDWSLTVANLKRGVRQEISRYLRKHRYSTQCSFGIDAIASFYDDLFVPSTRERYGFNAVIAPKRSFVSENLYTTRLDLLYGNEVIAANLLEVGGGTLYIRKAATLPGRDELTGCSDTLDYFSLLLAQLLDCEILDFGLSRPHLEDGVFRYKAKWGTELVPAGAMKADIRIAPQHLGTSVRAVLHRNYFLQQRDRGFVIRLLDRSSPDSARIARVERLADIEGLRDVELIKAPPGVENKPV